MKILRDWLAAYERRTDVIEAGIALWGETCTKPPIDPGGLIPVDEVGIDPVERERRKRSNGFETWLGEEGPDDPREVELLYLARRSHESGSSEAFSGSNESPEDVLRDFGVPEVCW